MTPRRNLRAILTAIACFAFIPSLQAQADAGLVSDDFNLACGLLGAEWTIVDPLADGGFLITGVGTSDARLEISVPAGTTHSIWGDGITAPMLMQAAFDDDFEIEVKYDAVPTETIQTQGIVVEGEGGELLRFDFYSNKNKLRVFAGLVAGGSGTAYFNSRITSGSSELYMRVNRTGDTFTQSYSFNGSDWVTTISFDVPIVLSGVGLWAGNNGDNPAHTSVVDYFFVTNAPILPEDGSVSGDDSPKTLDVVLAGTGSGSVSKNPDLAEYACGSSVELTANPVPGTSFTGWSGGIVTTENPVTIMMAADLALVATFELITDPPIISGVSTSTSMDGATISWTTDYGATSIVDFGETSGYELGSVFDSAYVTSHSLDITGLTADTLYHYEITSVGEITGLAASTGDLTFTTAPPPTGPSDIFSDDFNRACGALDARWMWVDPVGDSTVDVVGVGTADAQLQISVPAGVEHNAWTSGLTIPRLVQPMNDADFEVETRFESVLIGDIPGQGILLEDGLGDFVRFDFYSSGGKIRIFAADIAAGVATVHVSQVIPAEYSEYMRVGRALDLWSLEYSNDGIIWWPAGSFTLDFAPVQIGVFALNAGGLPAQTAIVDYFFNTDIPISPEDGSVAGETIPRVLTLAAGTGGTASVDPDQPTYTCGIPVTLTATPDAGYVFHKWSGDFDSTSNPLVIPMWDDVSVTANFALDVDPIISELSVAAGGDFATVSWTTDVPTTSVVNYGASAAYEDGAVSDLVLKTDHNIQLNGLTPDALYHFEASSTSEIGNSDATGDQLFATGNPGSDPSLVVSDDFNSECNLLGAQWSIVDPLGDSTISLVGLGTDDAQLLISVPSGVEHNLSTGNLNAPRVLQPIADGNFEVEAKFDSPLTLGTQAQGIVIQESATEFIRFGMYYNGKRLKAYAGIFSNDSLMTQANAKLSLTAPYYVRVTRVGDNWTHAVSDDGISWTQVANFDYVIAVADAGVYALNSKTHPAHTAAVDYFISSNTPVIPEDGPADTGSDKTLDVFVNGAGSVSPTPDQPTYSCGESVALMALADFGSVFTGWTGDLTSSENPLYLSMVSNTELTASFEIDTEAPLISNLQTYAGGTSALVIWTTNEPATSLVDFGPTAAYENGAAGDASTVTAHAVLLTGLDPESSYHYRVTTVDANGLSTVTGDFSFTTGVDRGASGITSDDFAAYNVDLSTWVLVDPLADTAIVINGAGGANSSLVLNVPAGDDHAVSATSVNAPRLLQATADSDLRIEVGIDTALSADFQAQGIWIQAGPDEFITFDRHTQGMSDRLAATRYSAGSSVVEIDVPIPTAAAIQLRVERLGDGWVYSYAMDGSTFTPVGNFAHAMTVVASGVFAANESTGGGAPALASSFDFYFDPDAPIIPEDGSTPADLDAPLLQVIDTDATDTSVEIRWTTDEPATSEVVYGPTAAYELGSIFDATLVHNHVVVLSGLDAESLYHFQIISEDALVQAASSSDITFTTFYLGYTGGPIVDFWYGQNQNFGHAGLMQGWVNILGNVADDDGVISLEYTLNGGIARPLTQGPDTRRLADLGDFNCDIDPADLLQGLNTVSVTAVDGDGNISTRDVVVNYDGETIPPLPITIDWSTVSNIQDVAQPIDGLWEIEGDTVRALQLDYDRLLGVGDVSYSDYEMTVPITVYSMDLGGFESPSNQPGVGIMLRWPGHTIRNSDQPANGFLPLGAIGFLRYKTSGNTRMSIVANTGTQTAKFRASFGVTYMHKMRVETVPGVGGLYSVKIWEQGDPEPADWLITRQETLGDPQEGAPVLVSHHVDASFGTVVITEVP